MAEIKLKYGTFKIEIETILAPPSDEDFQSSVQGASGIAIQFGANFHAGFELNNKKNKYGILQFVKSNFILSEKCLGDFDPRIDKQINPDEQTVADESAYTNVCIDKGLDNSSRLCDYLYGNEKVRIANDRRYGICKNQPTAVRGKGVCEVYDTPREMKQFYAGRLRNLPYVIKFWHFPVAVMENDHCLLCQTGIRWSLCLEQKKNQNGYLNQYELQVSEPEAVPLSEIKYRHILERINKNNYEIVDLF